MLQIIKAKLRQINCVHAWEYKQSFVDSDIRKHIQCCCKCKKKVVVLKNEPYLIYGK